LSSHLKKEKKSGKKGQLLLTDPFILSLASINFSSRIIKGHLRRGGE
jgi:hypothetical protein